MRINHATPSLYFDYNVDLHCQTIEATQQSLLRPDFEAVLHQNLSCKKRLVHFCRCHWAILSKTQALRLF